MKLSQPKLDLIECVNNYVHTMYVHIMCECVVCVCSVQTKGLVKLRTGLGPIYEIFGLDTGFGFVLGLGATCVFVYVTTSAIYKK